VVEPGLRLDASARPTISGEIGGIAQSMFKALRADRRPTSRLRDESTRAFRNCRGCSMPSGNRWRPRLDLMRPIIECDCLSAVSDIRSALNAITLGFLRCRNSKPRCAFAGSGHKDTHGPWGGVKLGLRYFDVGREWLTVGIEGQRDC